MDRLHALQVFARSVETASFSAAARDLKIGQPAVSKTVAALERELGTRLLLRTTRTLRPTEAGLALYERARRILDETDEAWSTAQHLHARLEGRIRVCAPVTLARLHVAPRIPEFLAAHPQLRLEFILDDRTVDLVEAGVDVALRTGALADSSMAARRIASCPMRLVASRRYLDERGIPRDPSDLLDHDVVLYSGSGGNGEWRFRRGTAARSVRVRSRLAFSAAEGLRAAVIAGAGCALVSEWMMAPELADGSVVAVLRDWSLPALDLWAVYPAGRSPGVKSRTFVRWIEQVFARPPAAPDGRAGPQSLPGGSPEPSVRRRTPRRSRKDTIG